MKRVFALLMIVCILCTAGITALATENESVAVVYGADFAYIVNIPAAVVAKANQLKNYAEVKIEEALLPSKTALTVSVTGDSWDSGSWHLHSADNKIAYNVMAEDDGQYSSVNNNAEILRCTAGEKCPLSRSVCFVLRAVTNAGTYNDILTFVIAYTNV